MAIIEVIIDMRSDTDPTVNVRHGALKYVLETANIVTPCKTQQTFIVTNF